MSAAEKLIPEEAPALVESEVERARREDPDFLEVQARAIARGRGETYSREKHGPFDPVPMPKRKRGEPETKPAADGNLAAIIDRFMANAPRRLRAIENMDSRKDLK